MTYFRTVRQKDGHYRICVDGRMVAMLKLRQAEEGEVAELLSKIGARENDR